MYVLRKENLGLIQGWEGCAAECVCNSRLTGGPQCLVLGGLPFLIIIGDNYIPPVNKKPCELPVTLPFKSKLSIRSLHFHRQLWAFEHEEFSAEELQFSEDEIINNSVPS